MKILITGGGGFLGSALTTTLLNRGALNGSSGDQEPIEEIVLIDARFVMRENDPRVQQIVGDISQRNVIDEAIGSSKNISIFHLASMVSGECEEHYDDALRVNLDGGRNVFEAARVAAGRSRVVFASSIASFGGAAMPTPVSDLGKQTPQTTYGMTKAETCELPVRRDQPPPMSGFRTVVDSFVALHEAPEDRLGDDRAYGLPAHQVTPAMAGKALSELAEEKNLALGQIEDAFDPRIQAIVDTWPTAVDGYRAVALGLPEPPPLKKIVEQYLEAFAQVE